MATIVLLAKVACMPSNELTPLRGEDPEALALSGDRAEWVSKTGATRTFERFREALIRKEWREVVALLGPNTLAVLTLRARESGIPIEGLLDRGGVEGLSLPGSDDPLRDLRAPIARPVAEDGRFDATRTAVTLIVRLKEREGPILVPAVHANGGWRVEMVHAMQEPPGPANRAEVLPRPPRSQPPTASEEP